MRPEWVKHVIRQSTVKTWCGLPSPWEWCFAGAEAAADNAAWGGRFVACPECVKAITEALEKPLAMLKPGA